MAQALLNKEENKQADTQKTPFGDLTATLNIHDNIIDNNDLKIASSDFIAEGQGSVDINQKTIEYKIKAFRQYADNQQHPNAYPLALRIKGSLRHPKVEPDLDLYIKLATERELRKRAEKELSKQLDKHLGKLLGKDNTTTTQETTTGEVNAATQPSTEDVIKDKLQKKLNKGLNKLFKKHDDEQQ
jgi:hypothetical protein